jgi:formate/nitrite transporter FocA (FNT family)
MDICPCLKHTNGLIFSSLVVKRSFIGVYMKSSIPAGIFASQAPIYSGAAQAYGIDASALGWGRFIFGSLAPATLGNIVGGAAIGSLLWTCHKKAD